MTDDVDPGTLNIARKGLKEVMVLSQISAMFDLHWTGPSRSYEASETKPPSHENIISIGVTRLCVKGKELTKGLYANCPSHGFSVSGVRREKHKIQNLNTEH